MVEKLRELNEKLINNYQDDSVNLEKQKLIKDSVQQMSKVERTGRFY